MKKEEKGLSIRDISRLSGVSIATVSRVINRNGRFSKDTEKRVLDIIEQYHYVPNMTARRLRTKEQNFIAIIIPDITNEFFARISQLLQELLLQKGYLALLCNTAENMDVQRQYLEMLGIVNLAGIIFVSGDAETSHLCGLMELPTIYIDRAPQGASLENALVVESDNYGGAAMAVREMAEKGCRRIAFLRSAQVITTHSFRQSGYLDELSRLGMKADPQLILQVNQVSFEDAKKRVNQLIAQKIEFDGIFCATDYLAVGAMEALQENGIRVPEQVKVVGFDDLSIARLAAQPITTIHQDIEAISQTAAEEMVRIIQGKENSTRRFQIGVSLIRRKTT